MAWGFLLSRRMNTVSHNFFQVSTNSSNLKVSDSSVLCGDAFSRQLGDIEEVQLWYCEESERNKGAGHLHNLLFQISWSWPPAFKTSEVEVVNDRKEFTFHKLLYLHLEVSGCSSLRRSVLSSLYSCLKHSTTLAENASDFCSLCSVLITFGILDIKDIMLCVGYSSRELAIFLCLICSYWNECGVDFGYVNAGWMHTLGRWRRWRHVGARTWSKSSFPPLLLRMLFTNCAHLQTLVSGLSLFYFCFVLQSLLDCLLL